MAARASVIIRSRDKAATIERSLLSIRAQTVPAEIIVVDSGSKDHTVAIAERLADRVIRIRPEEFTYGRALNIGAEAATADVHFALSAHSAPLHLTWIADSLALYERDDVAGTNSTALTPDGSPLEGVYYQTARDVLTNPSWGFSNHGSSWRATAWRAQPFREDLPAAEDKEWSWRVIADGWTLAYSPRLAVSDEHRREAGFRDLAKRVLRERRAMAAMGAVPPTSLAQTLDTWWNPDPYWVRRSLTRSRLSPWRMIEIGGTYVADRTWRHPFPVPALAELRRLADAAPDERAG